MFLWNQPYRIIEATETDNSVGYQDYPPSWEEIMQKKNPPENSVKCDHGSLAHKEKNPRSQEIELLTANQRLIRTLNKIISTLRTTAQRGTIVSDLVLLTCSLSALVLGCLIFQSHFEIVRVTFRTQFLTIGHILVVTSSLNIALFCPLGVVGALKERKCFLKWHNIWLLLNILIHLVFLYLCYRYLNKNEHKRKTDFQQAFRSIYDTCLIPKQGEDSGRCCCVKKVYRNRTCWEIDNENPENSMLWDGANWAHFDPNKDNFTNYLIEHDVVSQNCRADNTDYYQRTIGTIESGFLYLGIAIIVEGFPFFFGTLTVLVCHFPDREVIDEEAEESSVEAKKEKKRLSLFKKVLISFTVKRLFYICLTGVLVVIYYSIKEVTENVEFEVPVQGIPAKINLWNVIESIIKF